MGLHEFRAETERKFAERQAEFEQTMDSLGISMEILRQIYDVSREETDFRVRIELERISHMLENEREKTIREDLERKYCRGY